MDLPDAVDRAAIRAAVRLVAARHAALRTTYTAVADGSPRQTVWPVEAEAYPLGHFDDAERGQLWLRESQDIRSAWPLRIAVLDRAPGPDLLGIAAHHIACDRYGFDLLCRELHAALHAVAGRTTPDLPAPSRQPADIAAFECSADGAAANERAVAHWIGHHEELSEELSMLGAGFDRPSDAMHVARATSDDAAKRLCALAAAARSSEAAVGIAAVAGTLAGYLGRSSVLMFMTSANRHLRGVKHSVCSLAQAGLVRIDVPDPRDLRRLIPAAGLGALTASRHAYYDGDVLADRQRAAGGAGHRLPVAPPSVNVMRMDDLAPPDREPGGADGPLRTRVDQVGRPCIGLNFHVHLARSHLSIELRAGTHLLSAADSEMLVAGAMTSILDGQSPVVR
jgi:hypothetical protein